MALFGKSALHKRQWSVVFNPPFLEKLIGNWIIPCLKPDRQGVHARQYSAKSLP